MRFTHSFSVEVAMIVGDRKAVVLNNFAHWHLKNGTDGRNIIDGYVWTYNSIAAFGKVWPYLTASQIRTCLDSLEKEGYLKKGNYNEWKTDQTAWYALTEKGCELLEIPFSVELAHLPKIANGIAKNHKSNCEKSQIHLPESASPFVEIDKPIPDIKPIENQLQQQAEPVDVVDVDFEFAKRKINEVRATLLKSTKFRNDLCIPARVKAERWPDYVNKFCDIQIGFAEVKQTISFEQLKIHFKNWFWKQIELGTKSELHPNFNPQANAITGGKFTVNAPRSIVNYPVNELT